MKNYWDKEYPTHIEVPENYWVYSQDVEYINGDGNGSSST
jgi:hypothetical protein